MKIILNELGRKTILEWLRPKCVVCHLPIPDCPDLRKVRPFVYRRCCGCGRRMDGRLTRAYKIRWDAHYRQGLNEGGDQSR